MKERKRILAMTGIMIACVLIVSAVALTILYQASFEQTRARMVDIVETRARMLEAVTEHELLCHSEIYHTPNASEVAASHALAELADAHRHSEGFGETGEFTVAKLDNDSIVFILHQRLRESPELQAIALNSGLAQPMELALQGKSGSIVGLDYRGNRVLAAYRPVQLLGVGIVAKIDLAEVRTPFVRAGITVLILGLLVVAAGTLLSHRISAPIVAQLKGSAERLQLALEGAKDGFWDWDISSGHVIYGERWASMLGYKLDELESTEETFFSLLHPDDQGRVRAAIEEQYLDGSKHYSVELRMRCKSGEWKWILARGQVVARSKTGAPLRMVGTHYDISEVKAAQEAQQRSEMRFRAIFEHAPIGIGLGDIKGHLLISNASLQHLLGRSAAELADKPFVDIIDPDHTLEERELYQALFDGKRERYQLEKRLDKTNGEPRWLNINLASIHDDEGILEAVVLLVEDVSERKAAAAALKEQLTFVQALIETIPSPLYYKDAQGTYLGCNRAFEEFAGLRREEIIGRTIYDLTPMEPAELFHKKDMELIASPGSQVFETRAVNRSELVRDLVFHKATFGSNSSEPEGLIGIVLDLTDQKNVERELRSSREQLREITGAAQDAIVMFNGRGTVVFWNPAAERIFQYSSSEATGRHVCDVSMTRESAAEFVPRIQAFGRTGTDPLFNTTFEMPLRRKNGEVFPAEVSLTALRYSDEWHAVAITRDVSERKQSELELARSEARYRTLVESAQEAIVVAQDGLLKYVNSQLVSITGLSKEELLSRPLLDLVHPDDREMVAEFHRRRLNGEVIEGTYDFRAIAEDGSVIWIQNSGVSIEWEGRPATLNFLTDVTSRKLAQKALEESETKFKTITESSADAIFITDRRGNYVYVNQTASELLGYSVEELTQMNISDLSMLEQVESNLRTLETLLSEGNLFTEISLVRKDGSRLPADLNAIILPNGLVYGSCRDITERKRAEEALRESKALLDATGRMARVGGWELIADTQEVRWTEETYRIHEVPADYKPPLDEAINFFHPDDRERLSQAIEHALKQGEPYDLELRFITAQGRELWTRTICQPQMVDGKTFRLLGTFQDITDRRRAEQEVQASEERFRNIVEFSPLSIIVVNLDTRIVTANRAAASLHGYPSPESMIGLSIADLCAQAEGATAHLQDMVLRDGPVHNLRIDLRRKNGQSFPAEMSISPIRDADRKVFAFVGMAEDISDNIRRQEERARSDKLESVGLLAAGIAHDFNNILTAIIGNISFAQLEAESESELSRCLAEAEAASRRAAQLTRQLLTFAKGGSPVLEATSISEIVEESIRFALRGTGVNAEFFVQKDLPAVRADAGQLSQVINNLAINASHAMNGAGRLWIGIECVKLRHAGAIPLEPGFYVQTTIADEGCGISQENLKRIFDPYFTTKDTGSGLGLASVYSIVKKHGGHIEVESHLGAGTTFYLYLPAIERFVQQTGSNSPKCMLRRGQGRILVVDDEDSIRQLATAILEMAGYRVASASNGTEALDMYQRNLENGEQYDLLIVDLTMPGGLSGKDLMANLKELNPQIRAIVSSGYSADEVMSNHREYGFAGRLAKPFTASGLAEVVYEALRQPAGVSEPTQV